MTTASLLQSSTFTLRPAGGGAAIGGAVAAAGAQATFVPSNPLLPGTQYAAKITREARDRAGNQLAADYTWTFTTGANQDKTPPTVSLVSPTNNATNVSTNATITAMFSEPVTVSTINTANFTLVAAVGGAAVGGTVSLNGNTARFSPSTALLPDTQYRARVTTGVTDTSSNAMVSDFTWTFRTAAAPDNTRPTVIARSPAGGAINVALNSSVTVTFSEPMTNSTLNTSSITLRPTAGGAQVASTVNVSGNTATLTPLAPLADATQYTATVTTAARDAAGNAMAANFTWNFTTAPIPDTTRPTVTTVVPSGGTVNVARSTTLTATFSEPMRASSLTTASFLLDTTAGGVPTAGTVSVSTNGRTATFTPVAILDPGTSYTATITTAARDVAGNTLASDFNWVFLTAPADTTPPTVTSTVPASSATGVSLNATVSATFSEPMNNATLDAGSFIVHRSVDLVGIGGSVTVTGNTATFRPTNPLQASTQYTARINTAAEDAAGNPIATEHSWIFTTIGPADTSATLAWDPVVFANLSGYRIYYGTTPGVYIQAKGAGVNVGNVLTHTVNGLTGGRRYYFAATAYDNAGNESGYSNEVFKDIP